MNDLEAFTNKLGELCTVVEGINHKMRQVITTGEAGAGLVRVTTNAYREMLQVEIDDSLLTPANKRVLTDLLIAAANQSFKDGEEALKHQLLNANSDS